VQCKLVVFNREGQEEGDKKAEGKESKEMK